MARMILVEPIGKRLYEVTVDDLKTAYDLMRVELVDIVNLGAGMSMLVDDEGFMRQDAPQRGFFAFNSQPARVYAGRALIYSPSMHGDFGDAKMSTEELAPEISFFGYDEALFRLRELDKMIARKFGPNANVVKISAAELLAGAKREGNE